MEKTLKRLLAALLCALFALLPFSGIKESFAVQNIEKSAMVKSVGLDSGKEARISYVSSVIDDSSAFHKQSVISAAGGSFAAAEQQAQILADKYLTLSYAKHYLIGLPTAATGLESVFQYLLADEVLPLSSYVYLCEGAAEQMLENISKDSISTDEVLTNLNAAGKEEGYYSPVTVLECAAALKENSCLALPIIGQTQNGVNTAKKTVLVFKGYALLQGGRLGAILGRRQSRAWNLLSDKHINTEVGCKGGDVAVSQTACKKRFRLQGDAVKEVDYQLHLKSRFVSFRGNVADTAAVRACVRDEQAILLAEVRSLLALLERVGLPPPDLLKALDIQTRGKLADLPAALKGARYRISLRQTQTTDFPLNKSL